MPSPLVCQVRRRLPVALVSLYGTLDETSVVSAVVSLRDCLADQPTTLVLDGAHLVVTSVGALRPLVALATDARLFPGASMSLCAVSAATRSLVERAAPGGDLVMCDDAEAVAERALRDPVPPRLDATLLPGPGMPAQSRELVSRACVEWRIPRLRRLAELIISELASNAVVHARTPAGVSVRLLGNCLQLAVRDGDPRLVYPPPTQVPGSDIAERGRGLLILDAMTDGWGSAPTATGKVVWARLSLSGPRPAPPS